MTERILHTTLAKAIGLISHREEFLAASLDRPFEHRVGYGREADFSPGAARVVFTGAAGGLWTARLDGRGRQRLIAGIAHDPRWSPDGRWIAYTLTVDSVSRVELIHPDGTDRHVFAP